MNFEKKSNNHSVLDKSSPLYKDCPHLDAYGVIRANGRINAAVGVSNNEMMKQPILLAANNQITKLIVSHFYERFHHLNHETVVNEMKQLFIIPTLRALLKKIRKFCATCKILNAKPIIPQMAELPDCRLSSLTSPFSYTGIEYFGPMTVMVGRRSEKRWGMLLTCLTIRVIHIEIFLSLSTDSCILGLRNFMAVIVEQHYKGSDRELE